MECPGNKRGSTVIVCIQAANPGCVLEDFVRWYSPRDWIEGKEEINEEEEETVIVRADSHPTDGWENDNWEEEGLSNEEIKTVSH